MAPYGRQRTIRLKNLEENAQQLSQLAARPGLQVRLQVREERRGGTTRVSSWAHPPTPLEQPHGETEPPHSEKADGAEPPQDASDSRS